MFFELSIATKAQLVYTTLFPKPRKRSSIRDETSEWYMCICVADSLEIGSCDVLHWPTPGLSYPAGCLLLGCLPNLLGDSHDTCKGTCARKDPMCHTSPSQTLPRKRFPDARGYDRGTATSLLPFYEPLLQVIIVVDATPGSEHRHSEGTTSNSRSYEASSPLAPTPAPACAFQ
jgi:hypothetical protein